MNNSWISNIGSLYNFLSLLNLASLNSSDLKYELLAANICSILSTALWRESHLTLICLIKLLYVVSQKLHTYPAAPCTWYFCQTNSSDQCSIPLCQFQTHLRRLQQPSGLHCELYDMGIQQNMEGFTSVTLDLMEFLVPMLLLVLSTPKAVQ